MPWERVDRATDLETIEPIDLLNLYAGPSFLTIDCRRILRIGMLPRSVPLRRKPKDSLETALDRIIEEYMFTQPPEDMTKALLLDFKGSEGGEEASDMAATAAYLRQHFGCTRVLRVKGGARALAESHHFLFGLSKEAQPKLPSQLTTKLFIGSTACALDTKLLGALGVTHVVSVLRRQLRLTHLAEDRHLLLKAGVAQCSGTDGVRSLASRALPFVLQAIESDEQRVLIHCEEVRPTSATLPLPRCQALKLHAHTGPCTRGVLPRTPVLSTHKHVAVTVVVLAYCLALHIG